MPTLADLTDDQFKTLLDEYFAQPEERQKLTPIETKLLAEKLNSHINIPLIKETKEEKILIKVIVKVDTFLYDNLPNEFYDLVRSSEDGIDDDEAKRLIKRLAKLANKYVDIPYIPEQFEYFAIRFVLAIIINAARKNIDFLKACDDADNLNIPNNKKADDQELEAMVA